MKHITKTCCSANIIELSIEHNYDEDLHRKSKYAIITLKSIADTTWSVAVTAKGHKETTEVYDMPEDFSIRVAGNTERETLLEAFQCVIDELKDYTW